MTDIATVNPNRPPIIALRERLEARKNELKAALPPDIRPETFIRAVITAATVNPEIQACSFQSLWTACMLACRDGLLPDGVEGAIVPYGSKATWIPMYQGLLRRFRRSGQFKWITADVVRQGDLIEHYVSETGPHFKHVPAWENYGQPIAGIYAMATTLDGGIFITSMSIQEADKIRAHSRAKREDSPWKLWPEEMYKKTALRRLSKLLPSGRDIIGDDEADADFMPEPDRKARPVAIASSSTDDAPAAAPDAVEQDAAGSASRPREPDTGGVSAPPSEETEEQRNRRLAYKRGQDAKAAGHKRTAVPGELRENPQLVMAWTLGWEGENFPDK